MKQRNLAASFRSKLLNHARDTQQDFNLVLTRYGLERLLYRLSVSKYSESYLLKGALLFDLWFDLPHRPTIDADLLGFGASDLPSLEKVFTEICGIHVEDGIQFNADSVNAAEIRKVCIPSQSSLRYAFLMTTGSTRI